MTGPEPFDHVQAGESGSIPAGVYRVVGTSEQLTLLRVGDADGRRVRTGEIVRVSRSVYTNFGAAENPDTGVSSGDFLAPFRASAKTIRDWLPF